MFHGFWSALILVVVPCRVRAPFCSLLISFRRKCCEVSAEQPDAAPQLMAVDTPAEEDDTIDSDDSSSDDDSRSEHPLALHKSDSRITRHLKTNSECLSTLSKTDNLASFFTIMARARNDTHLAVLEAIFIASYQPVLCSQKDHVRCLTLF